MYCQKTICEEIERPFCSKVDMSVRLVEGFQPLPETHTHVLADSWYLNKKLWKAAKMRNWDMTGGVEMQPPGSD
jgi:hypothetical protein